MLNAICTALLSLTLAGPIGADRDGIACRHLPDVIEASRENNIRPAIILALIFRESTWNPKAVSAAGACGLMQIIPRYTGDENTGVLKLTCEELLDPKINIWAGTKTLAYWINSYGKGDMLVGLCGYNAGFRCKGKDRSKPGTRYAKDILEIADRIESRLLEQQYRINSPDE